MSSINSVPDPKRTGVNNERQRARAREWATAYAARAAGIAGRRAWRARARARGGWSAEKAKTKEQMNGQILLPAVCLSLYLISRSRSVSPAQWDPSLDPVWEEVENSDGKQAKTTQLALSIISLSLFAFLYQ